MNKKLKGGTPKSTRLARRSLGEGGSPAQPGEAAQTLPTATFGGHGPRSSFSFLPFEVRYRICCMLHDGATFAAIAAVPEIAKAYKALGLKLTAPAVSRIKKSAEYREIVSRRSARQNAEYNDRLTAAFCRENDSADTIAETAKVALLKALSDLSNLLATAKRSEDGSDMSDPSDKISSLRHIAQSVAALSNQSKDNRIADLQKRLAEKEDQLEGVEAEWRAREAELLARIADLENNTANGMSAETLERVEEKIKLL